MTIALASLATAIQLSAYMLYARRVLGGGVQPNLATWSIWGLLTALNASSYFAMSGDWVKSLLPAANSVAVLLTSAIVVARGKWSELAWQDWLALAIGAGGAVVWYAFGSAVRANLIVQASFALGFLATIRGVLANPGREQSRPWFLWTLAYTLSVLVVLLRWNGHYEELANPGLSVLWHLTVAMLSLRTCRRAGVLALGLLVPGAFAQDLRPVQPIDAHAHIFATGPEVRALKLRFVNLAALDPYEGPFWKTLAPQHSRAIAVGAPWVSSFDPADFEKPGFARSVIADLEATFRQGAVGVKMYKTIGMHVRSKSGAYVMPDDPAFAPILDAIAARGKTLYAHLAEPIAAWRPLDPADPDYSYYKEHPEWHIRSAPGRPSKSAILAARDRMLARHPRLRVVGCHLGSMEEDVAEIAKRLDRYPNFAVDTAARVRHLTKQPDAKVRAFLVKYQDRVLYATDFSILPGDDVAAKAKQWQAELDADWKYFTRLGLPASVLRKLFHDNAVDWVLGN